LTHPEKCIEALASRIRSTLTPEEEQKFFDTCAEKIYKKDRYIGAQAQALLQQSRETGEPANEINQFSAHLPSFHYRTWATFIRENKDDINAFKLSRYLKERWHQQEHKEKWENIKTVQQIAGLVEDTYPKQKKRLSQALKIVLNEIEDMVRENREDDIRATIKSHRNAKRWMELYEYLANLNTTGFSFQLLEEINEVQPVAEEGVLWQQRRKILDELVEKSTRIDPEEFYPEYRETREEVRQLVEGCEDMADLEAAKEVEERITQIHANILNGIKNGENSAESKYNQLKRWEDELQLIKYSLPGEWDAYVSELNGDMIETLAGKFFKAIENGETIEDIKNKMEAVLTEAARLGIKENLDEYAPEDQEETIIEIHRHLDEWIEFDDSIERIFNAADPFTATNNQERIPVDLESVSGLVQRSPVFGKIRKKYRTAEEVIQFTRTTVDLLRNLLTTMKKEAGNILFNKPVIKFEAYERQFKAIEEKAAQVMVTHASHYHFTILDNLNRIIEIVGRLLFSTKTLQPRQADKEYMEQNSFILSITSAIEAGESLNRDFKKLKTTLKNRSQEDPPTLQDKFFQVILANRNKELLFPRSKAKETAAQYEAIMEAIHDSIEHYLKPVNARLSFPFPLLARDEMEDLKAKTGPLLKQMDKIELSYPGYEELVETYRDELEQWNHVMEIHEAVGRTDFDKAAKQVEKKIHEPAIRYPLQILVYYYRYLFQAEWKEEEWLNFFTRFSLDSIKVDESGYRLILNHYRKDARKNFEQFSPVGIETHYKVFKALFPSDDQLPYLAYLSHQSDTKEFLKNIQRTAVRPEAYKTTVKMLEQNQDWKKYMALYNQSPAKYKNYFENPVTTVLGKLEENYNRLVKQFETGDIKRTDIDEYIDKIPEDQNFLDYFSKSKRLRELHAGYNDIGVNFKKLESENIWTQDDFYNRLYRTLERHTDKFTGELAVVRATNRWAERIGTLRSIYDLGRELHRQADKLHETDTHYKIKAEEKYSEALRADIKEFLSVWNRFCDEIAQMKENKIFGDNFQHYYFEHLIRQWQKMSLFHLYEKAELETPQNLTKYFEMWEVVLKNHETFIDYYSDFNEKKDGLHFKVPGDVKILDEFIRLTIERLKQQGRLKKRGEQ
jgi:hypothetical protein